MIMSKNELEKAICVWPANASAPLSRDEQIMLIQTAKERHAAARERHRLLFEKDK